MSIYLIANIAIEDWQEYEQYQSGFLEIFGRYGGELLAVSDETEVMEGEWPYTRAVVLRFASREDARRWYDSPEYQKLAEHRLRASKGTLIAVTGFGP